LEEITVIEKSLLKAERLRRARTRAHEEALQRFNNELMDDEELALLRDRIRRLQKSLAS
jgi:hypothetical protein